MCVCVTCDKLSGKATGCPRKHRVDGRKYVLDDLCAQSLKRCQRVGVGRGRHPALVAMYNRNRENTSIYRGKTNPMFAANLEYPAKECKRCVCIYIHIYVRIYIYTVYIYISCINYSTKAYLVLRADHVRILISEMSSNVQRNPRTSHGDFPASDYWRVTIKPWNNKALGTLKHIGVITSLGLYYPNQTTIKMISIGVM